MPFEVVNEKFSRTLEFQEPEDVVEYLLGHFRERGHYVLEYDDVRWTDDDGRRWVAKGDFVLIHALAGVPFPMLPGMVLRDVQEHQP